MFLGILWEIFTPKVSGDYTFDVKVNIGKLLTFLR